MFGLILAGGTGTRLWPLSREFFAKQFISFDSDLSLLQDTVKRALRFCDDVYVVVNDSQFFLVKTQIEPLGLKEDHIIREPVGRSTAPAVALGLSSIKKLHGDADVLILPSDHILDDSFFDLVKKALPYTGGHLCIFGIKPTYPSTGYGYIKLGVQHGDGCDVAKFIEKPSKKTAERFFSTGEYLWNSGIFLFNTLLAEKEYREHLRSVGELFSKTEELLENYEAFPSISVDYAIMEKAEDVVVFRYDGRWSDVGSWQGVYEIRSKNPDGNAVKGDALLFKTSGSLIFGEDRLIAAVGVEDLVIVDTKDALLVSNKTDVEEVRRVVEELKKQGRSEASLHTTVHRPWGYYTVLEKGQRYKVKRLAVYPGKSISLQLHHHRAEHWIVVKGTARITKGRKTYKIHENESIYVPKSIKHRVENTGKVELHIIEIQTGEYVEEDDIKRFD